MKHVYPRKLIVIWLKIDGKVNNGKVMVESTFNFNFNFQDFKIAYNFFSYIITLL